MKVYIKEATIEGVKGWEVTYAGITRFTQDHWQALVYYHQAIESYKFMGLCDESTSQEVDS